MVSWVAVRAPRLGDPWHHTVENTSDPVFHMRPPAESVVDRFLRYVRIDTQSKEGQPVVPSTATQWELANLLAAELRALGVADVRVSEFCMVYGT